MSDDKLKEALKEYERKRLAKLKAAPAGPTLDVRSGNDIAMSAPEWAWEQRLVRGELNLLEGDQMMGKTTLAIELGARVSRGQPMPFDTTPRQARGVAFFSPEEDTGKAGLPRFIAAGGDRSRFFEFVRNPNSPAPQMVFPAGAGLLDATLTKMNQDGNEIGVLIIDGISVILDGDRSENSNNDVKEAMGSLLTVTRKHGVTVLALRHLGKSKDSSPIHRGVGSIAFGAMARSQWAVVEHPDNPERRLFAPLKWSYSQRRPLSIVFELASVDVKLDDGSSRSFGACRWLDESEISAAEAFEAMSKKAKGVANPKQVTEAVSAIEAAFADFEKDIPIEQQVTMPEALLKDAIVNSYKIPASAYFEAKRVLSQSKKFCAAKVNGAWHLQRQRSNGGRSFHERAGE